MVQGRIHAQAGHRAMSDPTPPFTCVRRIWEPYVYQDVKGFLIQVRQEFGIDKNRWFFRSDYSPEAETFAVDFYFANPHDAVVFALKYLS